MKKLIVWIIFLFLFLLFAIRVAGPVFLSGILTENLGVPVKVGRLDLSLIRSTLKLQAVEIQNPKTYRERTLAHIRECTAVYDLFAFFQNRIHLREFRIQVDFVSFEKNEQGRLNWLEFASLASLAKSKPHSSEKSSARGTVSPEVSRPGRKMEFQVDRILLSIGRIRSVDSASPDAPAKDFDAGIQNLEFRNVSDIPFLIQEIATGVLTRIGLNAFLPDWGRLGDILGESNKVPLEKLKENLDGWLGKTKTSALKEN